VGLYIGDGRMRMPDKKLYRRLVKDRFTGRASYDASVAYDPATINELIYFNSGQLLIDMGKAGDLSGDTKVNLIDFSRMSECWLEFDFSGSGADCIEVDINTSGVVDLDDLLYLVSYWLSS